jgi:putative peptide zinc metalloprotease protein
MQSLNDVFQSSRDRSFVLRRRPDLVVSEHVYRDERFWMIKDPLEMEFYRLNDEEYAILTFVDGKNSLEEINDKFAAKFPPQRLTHKELQAFILDLHTKSLLVYTNPGIGQRLIERSNEKKWKKFKQNFSGILSFKWRGVDPDQFLNLLTPWVGWMFSIVAVVCALLYISVAGIWLLVHADEFVSKLPGLTEYLQPRNWLLLVSVVMVMKVIHELGHGLCFKRFGGECHEIGVMFLLFIPTLYCSTTDSWLLKSKWQRAAIGAAGMYVELLIAATATFAWWFSEPGTFNMICLNIMATGSLSVLVLNGNPFLKYDGYYILSDILELPNLQERSGKVTQSAFLKYVLGIDEDAEPHSRVGTKILLVAYRLMAFAFRLLIVGTILFFLIDRFSPLGLGYFGLTIGASSVVALFLPPVIGLYQFFKIPGRLHRIEMRRSVPVLLGLVLLLVLASAVPLPRYVTCSFTIEPMDGKPLYVKKDAVLKAVHVRPGETIAVGTLIAELDNLDTRLAYSKLKAEGEEYAAELKLLVRSRETSPEAAARINKLQQSIDTNAASLREYEATLESFRIIAPRAGSVITEWKAKRSDSGENLNSWDGSPLADENIGSWLSSGQKLCTIGDLQSLNAVLAVNEHDITLLKLGQPVTLMLDSNAGSRFTSQIESIARSRAEQLPTSLSTKYGGSVQLQTSTGGESEQPNPADEHFEARVAIPQNNLHLSSGLRGQASVRVSSQTILSRFQNWFYRNFRKKL